MTIADKLLWIDLETTGLNPNSDQILQVALIVTDRGLNELATFERAIKATPTELEFMHERVKEMHTKTGLLDRCLSADAPELFDVETQAFKFIVSNFGEPDAEGELIGLKLGSVTVAGSTVSFDVGFLRYDMPSVYDLLHHRLLDVSALRVISDLWFPEAQFHDENKCVHEALADIRHSIARLRHYHAHLLGSR